MNSTRTAAHSARRPCPPTVVRALAPTKMSRAPHHVEKTTRADASSGASAFTTTARRRDVAHLLLFQLLSSLPPPRLYRPDASCSGVARSRGGPPDRSDPHVCSLFLISHLYVFSGNRVRAPHTLRGAVSRYVPHGHHVTCWDCRLTGSR